MQICYCIPIRPDYVERASLLDGIDYRLLLFLTTVILVLMLTRHDML